MWNREQRRGLVWVGLFFSTLVIGVLCLVFTSDPFQESRVSAKNPGASLQLATLEGTIVHALRGEPIGTPTIEVIDPEGRADPWIEASDVSEPGRFEVGGIPRHHALSLRISAEDFETIDVAIRVEEDADALLGEIGLRPLRRLSGVVVDAASQRVSGLVVTARPLFPTGSMGEGAAAETDERGAFDFGRRLVASRYRVAVTDSVNGGRELCASAIGIDLTAVDDVRDMCIESSSLVGASLRIANDTPFSAILAGEQRFELQQQSDGERAAEVFALAGRTRGVWLETPTRPGGAAHSIQVPLHWPPRDTSLRVPTSSTLDIEVVGGEPPFVVFARGSITLEGRAESGASRSSLLAGQRAIALPVFGADFEVLVVDSQGWVASTRAPLGKTLRLLPKEVGTVALAEGEAWDALPVRPESAPFSESPGPSRPPLCHGVFRSFLRFDGTSAAVPMTAEPDVRRWTGAVEDAEGRAVSGAAVWAIAPGEAALRSVTDVHGRFAIDAAADARLRVEAGESSAECAAGVERIVLRPGATVAVSVRGETGRAIEGARVKLGERTRYTNRDGLALFRGWTLERPGVIEIAYGESSFTPAAVPSLLDPADRAELEVFAYSPRKRSLQLVDHGGHSVANQPWSLRFEPPYHELPVRAGQTDADGRIEFADAPPGAFVLRVVAAWDAPREGRVDVADSETTVILLERLPLVDEGEGAGL